MTVKEIRLKARAKINLTLDVTGKREDGYHLLETIMQTVALYDGIYMKKLDKPEIKLKTNLPWLPVDERNLAWKAARIFFDATKKDPDGIEIRITKRIPTQAGMGGGSADAAAVLRALNRHYGEPFSIPNPDKVLFIGSYSGGEAFRSGCLFQRGNGQIFYFQPGHETFPTYYIPEVQTVIRNAVRFVAPRYRAEIKCPHVHHFGNPEGYEIKK